MHLLYLSCHIYVCRVVCSISLVSPMCLWGLCWCPLIPDLRNLCHLFPLSHYFCAHGWSEPPASPRPHGVRLACSSCCLAMLPLSWSLRESWLYLGISFFLWSMPISISGLLDSSVSGIFKSKRKPKDLTTVFVLGPKLPSLSSSFSLSEPWYVCLIHNV